MTATSERRNITQPSDWWAAFMTQAEESGMSLSEWMGHCAMQCLPARTSSKLSTRPAVGAPKRADDDAQ